MHAAPGPTIRARFVLSGQAVEATVEPGAARAVTVPLPPEGEPYDPDMRIVFQDHALLPDPWRAAGTREVGLGLVEIRYLPGDPAAR